MTHSSQGPDQPGDPASGTPEPESTAPLPDYWEQRFGGQPRPAQADPAQPGPAPTEPYQPGYAPPGPYQVGDQPPGPYQPGYAPAGEYQPGYQPPAPYQPGGQPPPGPYQPGYQAGYQAPYPPQGPGSDIYLSNPYLLAPPPRKTGPGRKLIAGGAVLAVLAAGAVAAYAYNTLSGGGTQPEKVLPATTVAFAKLDLDPAAGQKIAAYRLSKKFPKVVKGAGNLDEEKHSLLSSFFDDESELDYPTDIKPWLGDRIAVAAVPDRTSPTGIDPVLAVAYTDEAKMKAAMGKAARTERDFGYVTVDGYVLVSNSQPHAEAVLAGVRQGTLAKSGQFHSDLKSLHGDQIAIAWTDVAGALAAVRAGTSGTPSSRIENLRRLNSLAARGRMIVGVHAGSDYLEVSAVSRGAETGKRAASTPVNGTLAKLSAADTSGALEVTGLGESLRQAWNGASAALGLGTEFEDFIDQTGLQLPGDLAALFGTDTTFSFRLRSGGTGDPEIAAQVSTAQADRAMQLLDTLGEPFGFPSESLHARKIPGGYQVSTSPDYDPRPGPGVRTLGNDPTFQKAVPDRANATLIGYLNLGQILDADPSTSPQEKADWKHVGALGLSMVATSDGSRMTFRFTTR
ncbi:DUF3352 domain-containing protein [Jatrophihabitans sp.]|uniref:DUF3352 domain-containing protein n=1 Tax=Jatrophihabitans sp. TaxID=1932789 RepID=UPI002C4EAF07|nr:DUF3352 domain-containing protein [Jatrophihabitans sp.]